MVMSTAKLDTYDYEVVPLDCNLYKIVITFDRLINRGVSDLASELVVHDNHVYVEGHKYIVDKITSNNDIVTDEYQLILLARRL